MTRQRVLTSTTQLQSLCFRFTLVAGIARYPLRAYGLTTIQNGVPPRTRTENAEFVALSDIQFHQRDIELAGRERIEHPLSDLEADRLPLSYQHVEIGCPRRIRTFIYRVQSPACCRLHHRAINFFDACALCDNWRKQHRISRFLFVTRFPMQSC